MVNQLINGDYVVRGGGIVRLRGSSALAANCLFRLQCRRGSFPFLPELGSRLWQLGTERPSHREACARQYCIEALQGTGMEVREVSVRELDRVLAVEVTLETGAETINVEVTV